MSSIMIDIETLGRRNDAAIREVGLVAFEYDGTIISKRQFTVSPEVWNTYSRTFSGETIIWLKMGGSIDTEFNCRSYQELITNINRFMRAHLTENDHIWSKGHMDLEVLKDLYETLDEKIPWAFWQPRDMRTIIDLYKDNQNMPTRHSAMYDATQQTNELLKSITFIKSKLNQ